MLTQIRHQMASLGQNVCLHLYLNLPYSCVLLPSLSKWVSWTQVVFKASHIIFYHIAVSHYHNFPNDCHESSMFLKPHLIYFYHPLYDHYFLLSGFLSFLLFCILLYHQLIILESMDSMVWLSSQWQRSVHFFRGPDANTSHLQSPCRVPPHSWMVQAISLCSIPVI